jgi:ribosomal protein S18 acetylase RimI-like enzyme
MKIIKATLKHTGELMKLRQEFAWFHDSIAGRKKTTGWEKDYKKILTKELKSKNILKLLAIEGKEIVGMAFCELNPSTPGTGSWAVSKKTGLIKNVYIREKYRRKGIATKFFKECFKFMKKSKAGNAELMVAINNENAHRLYEKLGFKDVSIRMRKKI